MKKIMFNEKYGLTKAVLEGRKTMTRRIVVLPKGVNPDEIKTVFENSKKGYFQLFKSSIPDSDYFKIKSSYNIGEKVAIAQSYNSLNKMGFVAPEWCEHSCEDSAGYNNKMFVRADLMPYRIKITGMHLERLQDITEQECIYEGIRIKKGNLNGQVQFGEYTFDGWDDYSFDARVAFASLIEKVSGKGTWKRNPWVVAYKFELI